MYSHRRDNLSVSHPQREGKESVDINWSWCKRGDHAQSVWWRETHLAGIYIDITDYAFEWRYQSDFSERFWNHAHAHVSHSEGTEQEFGRRLHWGNILWNAIKAMAFPRDAVKAKKERNTTNHRGCMYLYVIAGWLPMNKEVLITVSALHVWRCFLASVLTF